MTDRQPGERPETEPTPHDELELEKQTIEDLEVSQEHTDVVKGGAASATDDCWP